MMAQEGEDDLMAKVPDILAGATAGMAFHEGFNEMLRRRYREKTDLMRTMIRVQKDIAAIEGILNS